MKKYLSILLAALVSAGAYGAATRYVTADSIKSSDLTKTWSMPSATDTLMGRAANETISGTKVFSSAIEIPNGTGTTPGIWTSTGGGKTGFYFGASGATFAYNTADILSFAATQFKSNVAMNLFVSSTASSPALFLLGESSTGLYRIGANNHGYSVSGSKVLDISASGLGVTGALNVSGTTTLSTGLSGLLKATSGVVSVGSAGTDYAAAPSGSANTPLFNNGSGGFTNGTRSGNTTKVATVTGSTTTDNCAKWDANGNIVDAGAACGSGGGSSSEAPIIYLTNPTGYGSTNTKIRKFGLKLKDTGTGYMTVTQSSTNGDSFTASTNGLFAVCYGDYSAGNPESTLITVNDSALTTNGTSNLSWTQGVRAFAASVSNNDYSQACDILNLSTNDEVRAHSDGGQDATDYLGYFYIVYLGSQSGSSLYLEGGNGYGSTNTLIRLYSNTRENTGTAFTVSNSATLGTTVTVNEDGTYWLCRADGNSSSVNSVIGAVTVNDSNVSATTPIDDGYASGVRMAMAVDQNYYTANGIVCGFLSLTNGDVVRAHDASSFKANGTSSQVYLRMIKISGTKQSVQVDHPSGYGSANTKIRYLTTINNQDPNSLVVSTSSAAGTVVAATTPAVYGMCYIDYGSTLSYTGVTVDTDGLTSTVEGLGWANGFRGVREWGGSSSTQTTCAFSYLQTRGRMYPHTTGSSGSTADINLVSMTAAKLN